MADKSFVLKVECPRSRGNEGYFSFEGLTEEEKSELILKSGIHGVKNGEDYCLVETSLFLETLNEIIGKRLEKIYEGKESDKVKQSIIMYNKLLFGKLSKLIDRPQTKFYASKPVNEESKEEQYPWVSQNRMEVLLSKILVPCEEKKSEGKSQQETIKFDENEIQLAVSDFFENIEEKVKGTFQNALDEAVMSKLSKMRSISFSEILKHGRLFKSIKDDAQTIVDYNKEKDPDLKNYFSENMENAYSNLYNGLSFRHSLEENIKNRLATLSIDNKEIRKMLQEHRDGQEQH